MSNGSAAAFKRLIVQIVSDYYNDTGKPISGAPLAEQLRLKYQQSHQQLGYQKLSEPVEELVKSNELSRNRHVKHLEVAPAGFLFEATDANHGRRPSGSYIREDAWPVFAMFHAHSIAVFDKQTSKFRLLSKDSLHPDSCLSVELPTNLDHRDWVMQFLKAEGLSIDPSLIKSASILKDFSGWMHQQPAFLQQKWKEFRASKVADAIRKWSDNNGFNATEFLSPVVPNYSARKTAPATEATDDSIRNTVLRCIADLSIDELNEIRLPLRVIFKHFKPRN
jgi:hypothetical protein